MGFVLNVAFESVINSLVLADDETSLDICLSFCDLEIIMETSFARNLGGLVLTSTWVALLLDP